MELAIKDDTSFLNLVTKALKENSPEWNEKKNRLEETITYFLLDEPFEIDLGVKYGAINKVIRKFKNDQLMTLMASQMPIFRYCSGFPPTWWENIIEMSCNATSITAGSC